MQIGIGEQELWALKSIPHADSHDSLDDLADVLRGLSREINDLIVCRMKKVIVFWVLFYWDMLLTSFLLLKRS